MIMVLSDKPAGAGEKLKGTILEIQRMSTEDGPGIRTTVFFKGCTLRCSWCHNPESISPRPQPQWIETRCIGCGTCRDICPEKALVWEDSGIRIDRRLCRGCGTCAEECPSTALEMWGREWEVEALAAEVAKDKAYFEQSGGGVTASGGEATMQPEFLAGILAACKARGLHTALDTCGQTSREALIRVLPMVDLVLFDLKEIDPERHRGFTGHSNKLILENLMFITGAIGKKPAVWLRTPIIPGATDDPGNIRGLGEFISRNLRNKIDRWELCAFNNLCRDKYLRLGLEWEFREADLMTVERMDELTEIARVASGMPDMTLWTGSTRRREQTPEPPELRLVKGGRKSQVYESREDL